MRSGNFSPPAASPEASTFIWPRPSAGCFPAPIHCRSIGNTVWRTAKVDAWSPHARRARHQFPDGTRRCGAADQENAKATRPEQSRTRPATVTARKLLEANSSRMAHHLPLGIVGHRIDVAPARTERQFPSHSQKLFPAGRRVSAGLMILGNTGLDARGPVADYSRTDN